jgi:hypothetical protein
MRNSIGRLRSTLAKALVTPNFVHFLLGSLALTTLVTPAASVDSEYTWLSDNKMRVLMNSVGNEPYSGQGLESHSMSSESMNIRSWDLVNEIDTQVTKF